VNGDNPLVLADFDRYWQSLGSRSSALYDLLNAKYLIGRKNIALDRGKYRVAYDGDPALNVYENTRVLPRAFIVYDARVAPNHTAALEAIHAADFDPARMVVLERAVDSGQRAAGNEQALVRIVGYGPNEIVLDVNTVRAGILVLSEVWYPGWTAHLTPYPLDPPLPSPELRSGEGRGGRGEWGEVLRANYLFRAVEVPAGAHRVRLLYDPWSFKVGAGLGVVTVIALVVWMSFLRRTQPARFSSASII
jgi:hypothetical protein